MALEFKEFPKMARLSREIIITEKIDGTNASIFIQQEVLEENYNSDVYSTPIDVTEVVEYQGTKYTIRAGSRNKWITPGKTTDNYGFASWVEQNAQELIKLGEGHHFGEWWGQGIQSGYGLKEKRFSLFNVSRWKDGGTDIRPSCCHVVPILYQGIFDTETVQQIVYQLSKYGSKAAPEFMDPEGIVVWHTAANIGFKKTIKNDDIPKSLVKNENT